MLITLIELNLSVLIGLYVKSANFEFRFEIRIAYDLFYDSLFGLHIFYDSRKLEKFLCANRQGNEMIAQSASEIINQRRKMFKIPLGFRKSCQESD